MEGLLTLIALPSSVEPNIEHTPCMYAVAATDALEQYVPDPDTDKPIPSFAIARTDQALPHCADDHMLIVAR